LKPAPPLLAHDSALPWRSVIVMIVLLNEAWNVRDALGHVLLDLLADALPAGLLLLTLISTRHLDSFFPS